MEKIEFGNLNSNVILIQLVDSNDLKGIENEIRLISEVTNDFHFVAFKVSNWNDDLTPWYAKGLFKNQDFNGKANDTLNELLEYANDSNKEYYLGGYSLAGLFSLWAAYNTDRFSGVVAASPSVWFDNFLEYTKEHKIKTNNVYLSLGDLEKNTKNSRMKLVEDNILEINDNLDVNHIFEMNQGNHFKDSDIRTAKGFIWLLNNKIK